MFDFPFGGMRLRLLVIILLALLPAAILTILDGGNHRAVLLAITAAAALAAALAAEFLILRKMHARSSAQIASAVNLEYARHRRTETLQAALYRIAALTQSADDLQEFYQALHAIIGELMQAPNLYIALYDPATGLVSYPYFIDEQDPTPEPTPLGRGCTDYVIRTGQPLWASLETHAELERRGEIELVGAASVDWLGVPLKRGDQTFGVLVVQSYDPELRFNEDDRDLLTFVSQHIASALERKRTEAAEREQSAFAQALVDTTAVLTSTLSYEEVLDRILAELGKVLAHDSADISRLTGQRVHIVRRRGYLQGETPTDVTSSFSIEHAPLFQRMITTEQAVAIPDILACSEWRTFEGITAAWTRSYAGAPIRSKGGILGFVSLNSATPSFFGPQHAARLQAFADQAGLAIENARLYEEVQRYASELEQRVEQRTAELSQRELALQQTAEALKAANLRLQELDQLKSEFISNVSHELRTPLANIKLYLSLLDRGKADKQAYYMATLRNEANLLHRLIDQVLDLTALDLNRENIALQPVEVNQLVHQIATTQAAFMTNRGLTFVCEPQPGLPDALGRPRMLGQVLTALLSNAMNYTQAGGTVTLRTGLDSEDGKTAVTIAISDTGPGIRAEDLSHIFERFYRGQSAQLTGAPGAGLGLAIAQEIMQRMGGRITAQSMPGQGSTFTIWVTAVPAAQKEEQE